MMEDAASDFEKVLESDANAQEVDDQIKELYVQEFVARKGFDTKCLLWYFNICVFVVSLTKYIVTTESCYGLGSSFRMTMDTFDSGFPGVDPMSCKKDYGIQTLFFCLLAACVFLTERRLLYWIIQATSLGLFCWKHLDFEENTEGIPHTANAIFHHRLLNLVEVCDLIVFWLFILTLSFHLNYARKELTAEERIAKLSKTSRTKSTGKNSGVTGGRMKNSKPYKESKTH